MTRELIPCRICGRVPTLVPYEQSIDGNHDRPASVTCRACGSSTVMDWHLFLEVSEEFGDEKYDKPTAYLSARFTGALNDAVVRKWNRENEGELCEGGSMSYSISLHDPVTREVIELDCPHDMRGGIYCAGGTRELWLNVTYNYAPHFRRVLGESGIRTIYGMTGAESIPVLEAAAARLADDASDDYWEATEGNAKRALLKLAAMAHLRPDGIWGGD